MARPLRLEFSGALYHITARGNERRNIYRKEKDYNLFLQILAQVVKEMNWLLHGHCLMPNHYHLILETREPNLSRGMRQLNGIYTQAFNRKHRRSGHLFQGRYKAILVQKETHLLELCRYIVLNPVRAGIVDKPEKWAFSSYQATAGLSSIPSFLYIDWTLSQFGSRKKKAQIAYQRFVAEGLNKPSPWSSLIGQIYLGTKAFRQELEKTLKGKAIPKEIPISQRHPVRPTMDEILGYVVKVYHVKVEELILPRRRIEAREVAIYLSRVLGGYDLVSIAKQFKIGYTRASQIVGKIRTKIESDKDFKKLIKAMEIGSGD